MNTEKCLQILRDIKDVAFATVDTDGLPQIRIIDIMLVENEKVYFCTARGKSFYKQLMTDDQVAITGMNKNYQMIRLNGTAEHLSDQKYWIDRIFTENPSMNDVYPGDSRYVLEAFCIARGETEFFDLGCTPIIRESFRLGNNDTDAARSEHTSAEHSLCNKGFEITEKCIQCGKCMQVCPQKCIEDFRINEKHCLHCGLCYEECPVSAVKKKGV